VRMINQELNLMINELELTGFQVRPASFNDVEAVVDLIRTVDLFERGGTDISAEDLQMDWQYQDFNIETDAWVVVPNTAGAHQQVVGYAGVWNRSDYVLLLGEGFVHPDYQKLGIGTTLLKLEIARAREYIPQADPGKRVILRNGMDVRDQTGREIHEKEGFQAVRYFFEMKIELESAPPEPALPDGIELRPFIQGQQDRVVFDAVEEAFQDHWGYTPWNYEYWKKHNLLRENFDPGLILMAWDGDQIAGASLCRITEQGGWVSQLAVRRPWRKKGLGKALLQRSFAEFFRRGINKVGLGVDADNPTGATKLYEKAGMHVAHQFVLYEKELRPGTSVPEG
jgi:mycothiol synthase